LGIVIPQPDSLVGLSLPLVIGQEVSQIERELLPGEGDAPLACIASIEESRSPDQSSLPNVLASTVEDLHSDQIVSNKPEYLDSCAVEQARSWVVVH
jgi:hypothetical protein